VERRSGKETAVSLQVDVMGAPYIRLVYLLRDSRGNTRDYDYPVSLLTSRCNIGGGFRYWFQCPGCHERVGVIYLPPGHSHFRCRNCHGLTYRSRTRDVITASGHTSRQMAKLRTEIKRRTWAGRPTRKVRRLRALEQRMCVFSPQISARMEKLRGLYLK
jgi:hypothetical protein